MTARAQGFEWVSLLEAALSGLRLKPDEFWALTPAELKLMLGQGRGAAPLNRDRLDALIQAFPDVTEERLDERS